MLTLPFTPQLPLRTPRLVLRAFEPGDHDALYAFQSLPDAVRFVPYEARTPETMRTALTAKLAGRRLAHDGDHLDLAVIEGDDGPLVGDVLLILRSVQHATVEVGYIFHPGHGGRGLATEAVAATVGLAFAAGAHRVVARVDARNHASRKLCTRLGLRQEAVLVDNELFKGEWSTEVDYAVLDREWPTREATRLLPGTFAGH